MFWEVGKVVWFSNLLKNFPQLVVIQTVKGFSMVKEAEVDVFLEFLCFFYDLMDVGNFPNPPCTPRSSQFTLCWNLWRTLRMTLLACEVSAIIRQFEHSLALPFFGIEMITDLFQSRGHCWVFKICCHIECSTLTASSFRIWNNSAGIPSPPSAFFS